jgi:ABC-type bacteriocin/lantibiotic exporter with double-glycine peptidase domain
MLAELRMTRIFAAHRPDTIRIADRVLTLSRSGKISEQPASLQAVPAAGTRFHRGESYVQPK